MTTSPVLGVIIPPSISMILYSMVTHCSLEKLFMTGFIPGVMIMTATCVYTYVICRRGDQVQTPAPTFKQVLAALREGFWSLMLPVIIFGGIFFRNVHRQRGGGGGQRLRLFRGRSSSIGT